MTLCKIEAKNATKIVTMKSSSYYNKKAFTTQNT